MNGPDLFTHCYQIKHTHHSGEDELASQSAAEQQDEDLQLALIRSASIQTAQDEQRRREEDQQQQQQALESDERTNSFTISR